MEYADEHANAEVVGERQEQSRQGNAVHKGIAERHALSTQGANGEHHDAPENGYDPDHPLVILSSILEVNDYANHKHQHKYYKHEVGGEYQPILHFLVFEDVLERHVPSKILVGDGESSGAQIGYLRLECIVLFSI